MSGSWARKGPTDIALHHHDICFRFYTSGYQLAAARALHWCVRGLTLQLARVEKARDALEREKCDERTWINIRFYIKYVTRLKLLIEMNLNMGISCAK